MDQSESEDSKRVDQRKEARFSKRLSVWIFTDDGRSDNPAMVDVSTAGVCLESNLDMRPGDTFHFRMSVPSKGQVNGIAEVRWIQSNDAAAHYLGAQFTSFGYIHQQKLRQYLEPYMKLEGYRWEQ